jgi:hypothetical protein
VVRNPIPIDAPSGDEMEVFPAQRAVNAPIIRWALWAFLILLLFEGALRKWFLPGLATPLLVVRDPILLFIYVMAFAHHAIPKSSLLLASQVLGILTFVVSMAAEKFIPEVALYGWRSNFLFLPLVYIMPMVLINRDVRRMGVVLLIIAIPMALLLVRQFQSPSTAWINIGVGGSEGYKTTFDKVRTSGTFSFVNGTNSFLGLCTAFIAYGLLQKSGKEQKLALIASPFLMVSLAVCGSRSAVLIVGQVLAGLLCFSLVRAKSQSGIFRVVISLGVIALVIAGFPLVKEGLLVHQTRFEASAASDEDSGQRILSWFRVDPYILETTPPLGKGLGLGTNAGAAYVTGGRAFLLAENEWDRIVLEVGLVLGTMFIVLRIAIVISVLNVAIAAFRRGNSLPALLFSASWMDMLISQFGQPTALGFAVFMCGLSLAAAQGVPEDVAAPASPLNRRQYPTNVRKRFAVATGRRESHAT